MDPLCTFIFAIIVVVTTLGIMWDICDILMESVPRGLDADAIQADLQKVVHPSHYSEDFASLCLHIHFRSCGSSGYVNLRSCCCLLSEPCMTTVGAFRCGQNA